MRKYFEFYNGAKINCGEAALATLGAELERLNSKKPIFLTSQTVTKLGVADKVLAAFGAKKVVLFDGVSQTVDMDLVREIKKEYQNEKCDGIVAVGGDGVMDTAKCLKLFLAQECDEILPIAGAGVFEKNFVPLIVIPTENGSGKEASGFFECGEYYVSAIGVQPNVVIIDEDVAMTAPARTVAGCGAYALANAIEAYFGSEEGDPAAIYAENAIKLLAKSLESAVRDGEDEEACRMAALAGTMSGIAYGNIPFGAAHALSEGLAEMTGEPIEEMFAITLVPAMKKARERFEDKLKNVLFLFSGATEYAETPDSERADRAIEEVGALLERLHEKCNLPTKISQTKIDRESFGKIAEAAANKRSAITSFSAITKEEFISLLSEAY